MSIKSWISTVQISRRARLLQSPDLAFPGVLANARSVLICLPRGLRELTLVKQFLPQIRDIFRSAQITLLSLPGVIVNDIYPRKGFQILTPTLDQTTWTGLPKASYLKLLEDYRFDLVLDMNLESTPFTCGVLLSLPAAVRVGRGNHLGQPFYNVEIKTRYLRDERNIYRSLVNTLEVIKQSADRPAGGATLN